MDILDVGSGGGILSESLAGLGANVKGIDACEGSFNNANDHLQQFRPELLKNLEYHLTSIEDFSKEKSTNPDLIIESF